MSYSATRARAGSSVHAPAGHCRRQITSPLLAGVHAGAVPELTDRDVRGA